MLSSISSSNISNVLNIVTFLIQVIQTLIVVVGVPLVIKQIQQQTSAIKIQSDSFRLTTYMQMMNEGSRISEMILERTELSDFYDEVKPPQSLSDSWDHLNAKFRKHYLYLGRILSLQEQAFVLWKGNWMDDKDYQATATQLKEIMEMQKFSAWWPALKPYYRQDFSRYVESLRGNMD
jgi:hypothetical protein